MEELGLGGKGGHGGGVEEGDRLRLPFLLTAPVVPYSAPFQCSTWLYWRVHCQGGAVGRIPCDSFEPYAAQLDVLHRHILSSGVGAGQRQRSSKAFECASSGSSFPFQIIARFLTGILLHDTGCR